MVAAVAALLTGGGAAAGPATAAPPATAPATAPAATPVLAAAGSTGVTLVGRGFGHGIGMSQYGARGRATAGQTYQQIVSAYYPGTTLGNRTDADPIRVWVERDTDDQTWFVAESGMTIQGSDPVAGTTRPAAAIPATISVGGVARTPDLWRLRLVSLTFVLEGRVGSTWYPNGSAAVTTTLTGARTATVGAADGTVRLVTGTSFREYRGTLSANRTTSGSPASVQTTVTTTMASYLRSVVPSEMPSSWPTEALRAQTVAARTYARFDRDVASRPWWFDTCDTTSCQVFNGVAEYTAAGAVRTRYEAAATDAAVSATSGVTVLHSGAPAFTQFSASNGGWSVAGSRPYLVAQADPYDAYPQWTVHLTASQLSARYPQIGSFRSLAVTRDGRGAFGGRVVDVVLRGTSGSVTVSGTAFRSAFGLRSTLWTPGAAQKDWNGDGRADVLAWDSSGALWLYPGADGGAFGRRAQIGHGWTIMSAVTQVTGFRGGTSAPGLLAVERASGRLLYYAGDGAGGFAARGVQVGSGWRGYTAVLGTHDWAGDGRPGLIARDGSGRLFLHGTTAAGGFQVARQIGHGWQIMDALAVAGDLTGDGYPDLVAREAATGALWLYPGNGRGTFLPRQSLPGTWPAWTALLGGADRDGDAVPDLVGQEPTGRLVLHPGDGRGGVGAGVQIGHGWTGFTLVR